jgi:hypothetical protein
MIEDPLNNRNFLFRRRVQKVRGLNPRVIERRIKPDNGDGIALKTFLQFWTLTVRIQTNGFRADSCAPQELSDVLDVDPIMMVGKMANIQKRFFCHPDNLRPAELQDLYGIMYSASMDGKGSALPLQTVHQNTTTRRVDRNQQRAGRFPCPPLFWPAEKSPVFHSLLDGKEPIAGRLLRVSMNEVLGLLRGAGALKKQHDRGDVGNSDASAFVAGKAREC